MLTRYLFGIVLGLGLLVAGACGGPPQAPSPAGGPPPPPPKAAGPGQPATARWEDLQAAARREGRIMVYAGAINPDVRKDMTLALENKFGLQTEFVSGRGAETIARYLREREANISAADVLIVGHTSHVGILKPRGFLRPLQPLLVLPEVTDAAAWPDGKMPFLDKDGMIIPLVPSFSPFVAINTDIVKQSDIQSYRDLLKPQWKGKIVLFDPNITGNGNTWAAFMLWVVYGVEPGKAYLGELARQDLFMTRDARLQIEWVARGKYPIAVGPTVAALMEFRRAGAPIDVALPAEGGQIIPAADTLGVPLAAPHPAAQALAVNWLLSKEGQALYSKASGRPAARADISTEGIDPFFLTPKGYKVFPTDEEFTAFSTSDTLMNITRDIFGPLLK
ncbi:MAG: extracellular solute-binding protein [Chloroflexi bacterium]|nr:extracellular solute-binding protein [Chloroflexota bacterium]